MMRSRQFCNSASLHPLWPGVLPAMRPLVLHAARPVEKAVRPALVQKVLQNAVLRVNKAVRPVEKAVLRVQKARFLPQCPSAPPPLLPSVLILQVHSQAAIPHSSTSGCEPFPICSICFSLWWCSIIFQHTFPLRASSRRESCRS